MEIEKLYNKHQVAELLNISHRTVEAWQRQGLIPFFKFAGSMQSAVRYRLSDLEKLVSDSYRPATSQRAKAK